MKKIRIISGYLKGQIIKTINHRHIKPTIHRIRETLFNWLISKIKKSYCLDCF
ncbi:RsmD family RNA methyltransferase, partial [Buchnera aphidicola]|uniref:RsmD family RNA methyltransferase n=1 Tax=Buchnera aphidicola TaxID=9 RepID=UPI0039E1FB97